MSIGDATCWWAADGDGDPVVLVHGTMDRSSSFGRVARHLGDRRVVRYDRRGYGRSQPLGPPTGIAQQVQDLLAVIDAAVGDVAVTVVGHSYGGTVALAASHGNPDRFVGVVAYEAPMPWYPWWPTASAGAEAVAAAAGPEDAGERFMRRMLGDQRWERLPRSTRAARRDEGRTLIAEMAHVRAPNDPAFDAGQLRRPVVASSGTEGAAHHRKAAEVLAEEAPHGSLVVVEGAGHGAHLTHPRPFARLLDGLDRSR